MVLNPLPLLPPSLPQLIPPSRPQNAHPVAAVMGFSRNPVAYMPANDLNIIGDGDNSADSTVSTLRALSQTVAAVLNPIDTIEPTALFRVPHLVWHCSASAADPTVRGRNTLMYIQPLQPQSPFGSIVYSYLSL
jgi:hypothetical protein